jgi:hypothetical protein
MDLRAEEMRAYADVLLRTVSSVLEAGPGSVQLGLDESVLDDWLNPRSAHFDALSKLPVPAPAPFLIPTPVSQRANSVKNDDPACLEPAEASMRLL